MLKGKKILIAVTGSIAAYKIPFLVRLLIKEQAEVKVILTASAKDFVSPLTLSTLSRNPVLSELFHSDSWANHVMLGRWADVMIIAPLSCNTLAKMAIGACDNLLMAVYLSATCKVAVAPAMDEDMYIHPATKRNLDKIASFGNIILPVNSGELASGLTGEGRMAEPEEILNWLKEYLLPVLPLSGTRALVTAGPTYEQIDPVRFIGNNSSGKMGIAIAEALQQAGASVTLVLGPTHLPPPHFVNTIPVRSAAEMFEACVKRFHETDIAVMNAAVADYSPASIAPNKIKKAEASLSIELTKTKDILKHLGTLKRDGQYLVGFALETDNEEQNARTKLSQKNADMIVLNSLNDRGAGFGGDTNKITIFEKGGETISFEAKQKVDVANDIVNAIIHYKR